MLVTFGYVFHNGAGELNPRRRFHFSFFLNGMSTLARKISCGERFFVHFLNVARKNFCDLAALTGGLLAEASCEQRLICALDPFAIRLFYAAV